MGYGIMPYSVSLATVRAVLGSKNAALLKRLRRKYASTLEHDRDPDLEVCTADALTHLVRGTPLHPDYGSRYGYAFKLLCDHFGEFLPNSAWSACPRITDWVKKVDKALKKAGVPPKLFGVAAHLVDRWAPIAIPEAGDWPGIGYLLASELPAVESALDAADLAGITNPEVRESAEEVALWVSMCEEEEQDLVCFTH
jgi:hypothetical protein